MTTLEAARDAATHAVGGPADRLLERLAETIGGRANVEAVFGRPITSGDVTVVPVARVRWGFGGGGGRADEAPGGAAAGSGGGGGAIADPLGYLEVRPGGATFVRIRDRYPSPALVLSVGIVIALGVRAVARLSRR